MALRELLASFGFEVDEKPLKDADNRIDALITKISNVGTAILGAFAVNQLFAFGDSLAKQADAIDDTAAMLGISTQAAQEFAFVARAAGDNAEEFLGAIGRLQVAAANAGKEGGEEMAASFHKLGIQLKDASGSARAADELFLDVADAIAKTKSQTERIGIATALFGRQGRALLPTLQQGREGINKMRAELRELGGGFDDAAIAAGGDFQVAQARVHTLWDSMRARIATGLLPALTWLLDKITDVGKAALALTKNTSIVEVTLGALAAVAGTFALKMAIANAPLLLMAGALAAVVLIVEDLYVLFNGGESLIGAWIDAWLGVGTAEKAVRSLKNAIDEVTEGLRDAMRMWEITKKSNFGFSIDKLSTDDLIAWDRILKRQGAREGSDERGFFNPNTFGPNDEQRRAGVQAFGGFMRVFGEGQGSANLQSGTTQTAADRGRAVTGTFTERRVIAGARTERAQVNVTSPITVNVSGVGETNPDALAQKISSKVHEVINDRNRAAYDALSQDAD